MCDAIHRQMSTNQMTTEWLVFNNVISQVSQCAPTLHGGNSRHGVSHLNDTLSRHRITLRRLRSREKSCITIRPPPRAGTASTVNGRSHKFRYASPYGRSFSNCFDSSGPRSISISASVRRDLECSAPPRGNKSTSVEKTHPKQAR